MNAFRVVVAAAALAAGLAGCSRQLAQLIATNQPPVLILAPVSTEPAGSDTYRVRLRWSSTDVDGRVLHYLYAVDPSSVDRVDASWTTPMAIRS